VTFSFKVEARRLVDVLMEPAKNILNLKLTCRLSPYRNETMGMNGFIGEILPVFKKWQHLRWLTMVEDLPMGRIDVDCPPFNIVCDIILGMKSLNYLCICDRFGEIEMIKFKREVDDWVKLHRPGFIFEMLNLRAENLVASSVSFCRFDDLEITTS
jgi:hypothetical protein